LLRDYADRAGIPLERTGALLIAWSPEQQAAFPEIVEKARRNGYRSIHPIPTAELYRREPHLGPGATGALLIPDEAAICPWTTTLAYATEAVLAGVRLLLATRVTAVRLVNNGAAYEVRTTAGTLGCRWLINAAGLGSDIVDRMVRPGTFTIRPRRGELIVFDKLARQLVNHILLPVPTARTKGVLIAPTVYGNVLLGPTAQDVSDRSDTGTTADGLSGLLADGRRIMPGLLNEEVTATYAGLRAATEHHDYQIDVDGESRYACVAGIRSTGLTASLAIGEHVVDQMAAAGLRLGKRPRSSPPVMPYIGESGMRPYQDADKIGADPAYGQIVCHCERVTRGEIRDALDGPIAPADREGLRRRTRALNGRCQGFYCAAAVSELMAGSPK
jgi:glycerol-3-phosphate dehydrogenase